MTTATLVTQGRTMYTEAARPRRSLEELVDQLIAAMGFADEADVETVGAVPRRPRRGRSTRPAG